MADAPRRRRPRRSVLLWVAVAAVALVIGATAWLLAEPAPSGAPAVRMQSAAADADVTPVGSAAGASADSTEQAASSTSTATIAKAGGSSTREAIEVSTSVETAQPFQTVPIRGVYRGGADTFLQVQHFTDGSWQSFPVPAKTDSSGQFTAYVDLGQPSRYRLRVLDPESHVSSEPFTVVIKG